MKKVYNLQLNLLTETYLVAKLGKPHSLYGYQYIKFDSFFKNLNLKAIELIIDNEIYIVEDFKKHLKDRNLIKFNKIKNINEVELLRNHNVYISKKYCNTLLNKDKLPWPGYFIKSIINKSGQKLLNYSIYNNLIFCRVEGFNEFEIPYNKDFFNYKNDILSLNENKLTINPAK